MNVALRSCLAAAGAAALTALTGCGIFLERNVPGLVDWRYHAINGVEITTEMTAFMVPQQTTKAEVVERLGCGGLNKPAWARPDGQALAFTWTEVREGSQRATKLYRPFGPHRGEVLFDYTDNWSEDRAICIVFDASDRVACHRFFAAKDRAALASLYQGWAGSATSARN